MSQTAKTTASGTESRLVRVLESYLTACQAGSAPEQREFLARHPELAEDLKDCLASLEFIGQGVLKPPLALPPHAGGAASDPPEAIQPEGPLGDYRIVREIGRGGMGVVYEAVQISLGRHVALKVLPFAAALDPKQLQRFKNEAQAAAHLHHTNIVPVFGVGCERGVHYYAMQYIEGQTLAAVIHEMQKKAGAREDTSPRESPSAKPEPAQSESRGAPPPDSQPSPETQSIAGRFTEGAPRKPDFYRAAAQLGIQAAEALDHAHQLGVVHRDIKPGNLLVDERGKLWITDFGLARFHNETGLTLSGDLLGTLRYMSPEQTLGNQALVDPRTDIYSLGATLYEFLTLRAVCDGTDRHQVLRQIEGAEPVSPRRLQPAIPADLETIILKTLAKEPASRYATAHELAEELERFLDDRPIQARRPTLVQRTRKWARRHRILVRSAAVSSLFLLLVATAGLGVGFYYVNAEKNRTEDARKGEAAQRRSAEQAAVDARAVLDFFQLQVLAAARPKNQDGGLGINATIRDAVHAAEPEIAGAFQDRPLVEASIRNTLGTSYWHWRENKAAIEQYERSLALRENQLGPNHPDTLTIMNNLATAYQANGQLDKALQLCEQTLAKRQEILGADHPDTLQSMNNLASAYRAAGQFDKGLPLDEQALAKSKDKLGPDHPDTLISMNNLAMAYSQAGRRDKALTLFEQTLMKRKEILGPDHPHTLSSMSNLAYAYQEVGQLDKALPLFEQTLAKQRNKLGPDHPDTITSMSNLANAYQQKGDFAKAEPLLRECLAVREKKQPDAWLTFDAKSQLGASLLVQKKYAEAEPLLRECLAFCEKKKPGAWPTFDTKSQLGASLLGQKKYAEAEPLLLAGYKGMKEHEAKIPASYKKYLTEALERLVQLYEALGKKDQAAQRRKELEDHHATKRH